jgi:hypothetical protein
MIRGPSTRVHSGDLSGATPRASCELGNAWLDFRHDRYRGQRPFEGGLIVVKTKMDGRFCRAAWMSAADAQELRAQRRVPD